MGPTTSRDPPLSSAQPQLSGLPPPYTPFCGLLPAQPHIPLSPQQFLESPTTARHAGSTKGCQASSWPLRATCQPEGELGKRQGRVPIYLLARRGGLAGDAGVAAVRAVGHGSCLRLPGPPWLPLHLQCAWLPSFSLDFSSAQECLLGSSTPQPRSTLSSCPVLCCFLCHSALSSAPSFRSQPPVVSQNLGDVS